MANSKKSNTNSCGTPKRYRNFACVVYPESAPDNWQEILTRQFVPAFVSPLHDKDMDPQNQPKKPHFHVILMFDGVKTCEQAKSVFDAIGGVGCETVNSIRGYCRYLCHLDNPEKAQYNPDDVRSFCGADYLNVIGLATDKHKAIREMINFIDENNIVAYCDLMVYAMDERPDWFRVLCDNGTYVIKEYIISHSWKIENKLKKECGSYEC